MSNETSKNIPTNVLKDGQFTSLEECLNKYIPADELKEVKRIIFGKSDEYENF